jgi:diketogulonate reductase-like aldo/keto reductase
MEKLSQDKVKAIGIKGGLGLTKAILEKILHQTKTKPAVIEVLTTAETPASELIDFCRDQYVHVLSRVENEVWLEAQPGAEELEDLCKTHKADLRVILISWERKCSIHS